MEEQKQEKVEEKKDKPKPRKGHRKRNKGRKGLGFSDKEYVEQLKINKAQIAFFIFTVEFSFLHPYLLVIERFNEF